MNEDTNPLVCLFGKTWHYSKGNRKQAVSYWIMFVISESINVFWSPIVWAKVLNVVKDEGITEKSARKLYFLLSLLILRTLLSWLFHGTGRVMEQVNAFLVRANYREYLLKGVMNMPLEWHTEHHSGDTIDRVNKGTDALYNFTEDSFQIVKAAVKLIACFGMIVYYSPTSGLVVLTMMSLSVLVTMYFDGVVSPLYQKLNRSENHIAESIFDSISNISTVIILRVEKFVFSAIMHQVMNPLSVFKRNVRLNEWKWFLTSFCNSIMIVSVIALFFYQNIGSEKGVMVGTVYILINFLNQLGELFYTFTSEYGSIIRQKFRLLNAEELAESFQSENFTNHVLPANWRELQIDNLNFSYNTEAGQNLHLDDVSLTLHRGEKIAFVGETGSGKTTLLKLMRDLYHALTLKLSVDGKAISDGFGGIARAISLVPQNPEIFSNSIWWNITLGAEYDIEFVKRYTDMACFTDVAESLPNKFESSIKEKGVNLSGGQQQRLALSRGLLACHDKDIVLLDEPTSSLDIANEMLVYRNIFHGFEGKTVISSIHRLHLLPLFDNIYMFEKGRIIGSGTVNELLSSCPAFTELWQKQYVDPAL